MKYMLDTDTCSYLIKGVPSVVNKARETKGQWCISSVVYQELMFGMLTTKSSRMEAGYEKFLRTVPVVTYSQADALAAADLSASNRKVGHVIGLADNQIAGHAASVGLTLVTNNLKHFQKIRGIHVVTWSQ